MCKAPEPLPVDPPPRGAPERLDLEDLLAVPLTWDQALALGSHAAREYEENRRSPGRLRQLPPGTYRTAERLGVGDSVVVDFGAGALRRAVPGRGHGVVAAVTPEGHVILG